MKPRYFRHKDGFFRDHVALVKYDPTMESNDLNTVCVHFGGQTSYCFLTVPQVLRAHHDGTYIELTEEEAQAYIHSKPAPKDESRVIATA